MGRWRDLKAATGGLRGRDFRYIIVVVLKSPRRVRLECWAGGTAKKEIRRIRHGVCGDECVCVCTFEGWWPPPSTPLNKRVGRGGGEANRSAEGVKRAADGLIRRNVNQIFSARGWLVDTARARARSRPGFIALVAHLHVYAIRNRRRGNNRGNDNDTMTTTATAARRRLDARRRFLIIYRSRTIIITRGGVDGA